MQHVLAMFTGNIAPFIIIFDVLGLSAKQKTFMIQFVKIVARLVTLVQVYTVGRVGEGLPLGQGDLFYICINCNCSWRALRTTGHIGGLCGRFHC